MIFRIILLILSSMSSYIMSMQVAADFHDTSGWMVMKVL
jgi:hypothetical protein